MVAFRVRPVWVRDLVLNPLSDPGGVWQVRHCQGEVPSSELALVRSSLGASTRQGSPPSSQTRLESLPKEAIFIKNCVLACT